MTEFRETKNLLDEINATISAYDPILREPARDILLREVFGWEKHDRPNGHTDPLKPGEPQKGDAPSGQKARAVTFGNFAETWLPRSGVDRALLSLYYLKKVLSLKSATGYQISLELRESGMALSNISVAMQRNVSLLRAQSRVVNGKKGTKARREYAITDLGVQYVESRFDLDNDGR